MKFFDDFLGCKIDCKQRLSYKEALAAILRNSENIGTLLVWIESDLQLRIIADALKSNQYITDIFFDGDINPTLSSAKERFAKYLSAIEDICERNRTGIFPNVSPHCPHLQPDLSNVAEQSVPIFVLDY